MSLQLFMHPLSSYCHKVLIAFYENNIPFDVLRVDQPEVGAEFGKLWPVNRFPLLRDTARGEVIPESSIIIEYLQQYYPGPVQLMPSDPEHARQVRLKDRFCDLYLHASMQKFAFDQRRPADQHDLYGIEEAKKMYFTALDMLEADIAGKTWITGETFTLADCAAAPALFYGDRFYGPFRDSHPQTGAYLDRLMARPSYARALEEAKPFFHFLPK
jgi:glutathione S-transferase